MSRFLSVLFIFSVSVSFSLSVRAEGSASKIANSAKSAAQTMQTYWRGDKCTIPYSSLRFMGLEESGMQTSGSASCSGMGCWMGGTNVDPFAHEWGGSETGLYGLAGGISRTVTDGRYTYCSNDPSNSPQTKCARIMELPASKNSVNTTWDGQSCKCEVTVQGRTNGSSECSPQFMTEIDSRIQEIRRKYNLPEDGEQSTCVSGLVPLNGGSPGQCACSANPTVAVANNASSVATCSTQLTPQQQQALADALAAQQEQEARRRIDAYRSCASRINSEFDRICSAAATQAVEACDIESDANAENQAIADMINTVGRANTLAKANTGARDQCFRGGLVASTAAQALRGQYMPRCNGAINGCDENCKFEERVTARIESQCGSILTSGSVPLPQGSAAHQLLTEQSQEIFGNLSDPSAAASASINECKSVAREKENRAAQMIKVVDDAYTSSAICQCQLSTSPGIACNAIPTAAQCRENMELKGCELYANFAVCAVGTPTYNASLCLCVNSPQTSGCSTNNVTTTIANSVRDTRNLNGPSGFAGGVKPSMGSSGSNGSGGGFDSFGSSSGSDSDGVADVTLRSAGEGGVSVGGGQNSTGSGFSGGSVGAGSGSGEVSDKLNSGETKESDSGIVGGMFSNIKAAVANMLGRGGRGSGSFSSRAPENENAFDAKKFKPKRLRGINGFDEGQSQIGAANMDIWKMMNRCTRGDSCPSNIDGYLKDP